MTGDVTINPNASCLVMTTEVHFDIIFFFFFFSFFLFLFAFEESFQAS